VGIPAYVFSTDSLWCRTRTACITTQKNNDDGAGLLYRGTDFVEAVSERAGAAAYFVDAVEEIRLDTRRL